MALEQHERINEHIEYVSTLGNKMNQHVISLRGEEHATWKAAIRLLEEGCTNVVIVTERTTWRGKNGKRHYEELSREPVVLTEVVRG